MGATFRIVEFHGCHVPHCCIVKNRHWVPLITTSQLVPIAPTRSVAPTPIRGYLLGIFTLSSS